MKLNHWLIIAGFILSGLVTYFTLDKKVGQIEILLQLNYSKMELHVEKRINTLKDDSFIMKRKKTMFTLINTNIKQESTIYIIKVKNILKIVSIIVTPNAKIINIE